MSILGSQMLMNIRWEGKAMGMTITRPEPELEDVSRNQTAIQFNHFAPVGTQALSVVEEMVHAV